VERRLARPIALALIRRADAVLVFEVPDPVKGVVGYRPLGGTIEFGERGADAVAREIREEVGADLVDVVYLGTLENIFEYLGRPGHELALIYEARFADATLYERDVIEAREANGSPLRCTWKSLTDFERGEALYPNGLLALATAWLARAAAREAPRSTPRR